jgi:hypothetical protein
MDRRAPLFWRTLPMAMTRQSVQASVPNSGANSVRGEHLWSLPDPSVRASPPTAPSGVPVPDVCPLITREVSCVSPPIRCVLTVPCACPMISSALIVSSGCQSGPFTLGASVRKIIEFEKNARFSDCRSLTRSATVSRISSSYPTSLQWADHPSTT